MVKSTAPAFLCQLLKRFQRPFSGEEHGQDFSIFSFGVVLEPERLNLMPEIIGKGKQSSLTG